MLPARPPPRAAQDAAMPLLEALMPGVGRLLEKGRFPEERRIAICVMDDIIEHAPGGAAKYMGQVRAHLLALGMWGTVCGMGIFCLQ